MSNFQVKYCFTWKITANSTYETTILCKNVTQKEKKKMKTNNQTKTNKKNKQKTYKTREDSGR